jgi:hypothetical protein
VYRSSPWAKAKLRPGAACAQASHAAFNTLQEKLTTKIAHCNREIIMGVPQKISGLGGSLAPPR